MKPKKKDLSKDLVQFPQSLSQFLTENIDKDVAKLALTQKYPLEWLQQLSARQKAIEKLPTWAKNPHIRYQKLALEQCSSEITASYKAFLLRNCIFPRNNNVENQNNLQNFTEIADITGGFGVDTYFFAQYFSKVWHVEMQKDLQDMAKANFEELNPKKNTQNIAFFHGKDMDFLDFFKSEKNIIINTENSKETQLSKLKAIYIDPHRRENTQDTDKKNTQNTQIIEKIDTNKKVFRLEDCQPNILENLHKYFEVAEIIMVKVSPFLDILQGLKLLKYAFQCYILSVDNEVKEILYFLKRKKFENAENLDISSDFPENTPIFVVDLDKKTPLTETFNFQYSISQENQLENTVLSLPKQYLYEPFPALMKAGAFKTFAQRYQLEKLHQNTHLYTSDRFIFDLPAKVFEVLATLPYQKKAVLDFLQGEKAEISIRNFKDKIQDVQKKLGITKTGGNTQLFAFTNIDEKMQILATRRILTS